MTGEPGIGKSRLLEVGLGLAREAGAWALQASAFESEAIRPFALWTDALRGVDPEAAASIFGNADRGDRRQFFEDLSALLAARLGDRPVVLSFDDVHWSDESSASALHFVVRSNADRPLLCLLASRIDELRDNAAMSRALRELRQANLLEEIRLGPLSREALRALIDAHAPGAAASGSARIAAAIRCSRSSWRAPSSRATAARRSTSSCRSASQASKGTTARCCAGPPCLRRGSMRRRSHA